MIAFNGLPKDTLMFDWCPWNWCGSFVLVGAVGCKFGCLYSACTHTLRRWIVVLANALIGSGEGWLYLDSESCKCEYVRRPRGFTEGNPKLGPSKDHTGYWSYWICLEAWLLKDFRVIQSRCLLKRLAETNKACRKRATLRFVLYRDLSSAYHGLMFHDVSWMDDSWRFIVEALEIHFPSWLRYKIGEKAVQVQLRNEQASWTVAPDVAQILKVAWCFKVESQWKTTDT